MGLKNLIHRYKLAKFQVSHGLSNSGEQYLGYLIDRYINHKDCGIITKFEESLDDYVAHMKEDTNQHLFFRTIAKSEEDGRDLFRNYCAIEIISNFLLLLMPRTADFEYYINQIEDNLNRVTILNEVNRREEEFK